MKREIEELHKTIRNLNEEQENLLCLLQEMEVKCRKYAKALRKYNYNDFEDDDGNEEEEDEEEIVINGRSGDEKINGGGHISNLLES